MKIDLELLEEMVAAGATGSVILAYLRKIDGRRVPRRAADKVRKQSGKLRKVSGNGAENSGKPASTGVDETPRSRLFREGGNILATLGRSDRGARALLAGWAKATGDNDEMVIALLKEAQRLAVADVAGWVTATIKRNGNGAKRSNSDVADDLIARAEADESGADSGGRDHSGICRA